MLSDVCASMKEVYLPKARDTHWTKHLSLLDDLYKKSASRARENMGKDGAERDKEKDLPTHPGMPLNKVEKPAIYKEHGGGLFLVIKIDLETVRKLQLEIDVGGNRCGGFCLCERLVLVPAGRNRPCCTWTWWDWVFVV